VECGLFDRFRSRGVRWVPSVACSGLGEESSVVPSASRLFGFVGVACGGGAVAGRLLEESSG